MTDAQWFVCPICGEHQAGEPPHGLGSPCPQKVKIDQAYVDMLDAQRMSYLRSGSANERAADAAERMAAAVRGDDNE